MTYKIYPEQDVEDIAEAIRNKNGLSNKYKIGEMAEAINNLGIYSLSGEDNTPYLYRKTPLTSDAELDKIIGGTVVFNQLVDDSDFLSTGGIISTEDGVGSFTANAQNQQVYKSFQVIANHVYLGAVTFKTTTATSDVCGRMFGYDFDGITSTNWQTLVCIKLQLINSGVSIGVKDKRTSNWDEIKVKNYMTIDLTQMFGSTIADYAYQLEQATAGSGVAYLKSLGYFTDDYYPYNAGEIKSVSGLSSHDMVGKNLSSYNEYPSITSLWGASIDALVDIINELPVGTYTISNKYRIESVPSNNIVQHGGFYVTAMINGNQQPVNLYSTATDNAPTVGKVYTESKPLVITEENRGKINQCYYYCDSSVHTGTGRGTYKCYDIQIEFGTTATEYEPYVKHSYPLDNTLTLRGIPKLTDGKLYYDGDVYNSDGSVVRKYGVMTIQGSSITLAPDSYENVRYAILTRSSGEPLSSLYKKAINSKFGVGNIVYPFDDVNSVGKMVTNASSNQWWFGFAKNTTLEQAQAALDGTVLIYELAEPTTETAEPYSTIQICNGAGTEEYVTTGIPVGHETKYLEVVETIDINTSEV